MIYISIYIFFYSNATCRRPVFVELVIPVLVLVQVQIVGISVPFVKVHVKGLLYYTKFPRKNINACITGTCTSTSSTGPSSFTDTVQI